jgi:hypothetical protein
MLTLGPAGLYICAVCVSSEDVFTIGCCGLVYLLFVAQHVNWDLPLASAFIRLVKFTGMNFWIFLI